MRRLMEELKKRLKPVNLKVTFGKYLLGALFTLLCLLTSALGGWVKIGTNDLITNILIILIISIIVWTIAEIANWIAWIPAVMLGLGGCPVGCGWFFVFCLIIGATLWSIQQYFPFEKVSFGTNGSIVGISIIVAFICLSIRTQTTDALCEDARD